MSCEHEGPYVARVCKRLLESERTYTEAFSGRGVESELLCEGCSPDHVIAVCAACQQKAMAGERGGETGEPETIVSASPLRLVSEEIEIACPDLIDLQPVRGADRNLWLGLTAAAELLEIDLDARTTRRIWTSGRTRMAKLELVVSPHYAAVVDGTAIADQPVIGEVIALDTGRVTMTIERENYHAEHCNFPIAFFEREGRTIVCASPAWNRLDLYAAATGELLTARTIDRDTAHYLDYFHCALVVSPDQTWIAEHGWVWHPVGEVVAWSLDAWAANEFESEDGESRKLLSWASYHWDGPLAWLDNTHLLTWGRGDDVDNLKPALNVYDVTTGKLERWFAGVPQGAMYVDRYLYVIGERITIWDLARGARLLDEEHNVARYHPDAKVLASLVTGGRITIGRVCGEHAAWNRGVVADLVRAGDPADLHVLGDALESAGCDDAALLDHCRQPGPHGTHCWVFSTLRM